MAPLSVDEFNDSLGKIVGGLVTKEIYGTHTYVVHYIKSHTGEWVSECTNNNVEMRDLNVGHHSLTARECNERKKLDNFTSTGPRSSLSIHYKSYHLFLFTSIFCSCDLFLRTFNSFIPYQLILLDTLHILLNVKKKFTTIYFVS